ncbi:MAG: small ribosomal subunit Rsm22 family protein [Oscillospiraceae bacterium]|nr:small ribosomal subunit Rsm22 family protein [Oscillospiraceae bacterium]
MELPHGLKCAIDNRLEGIKHYELYKDSNELSIRYRNNNGSGKPLISDNNEALAYSIVRMPATFGSVYTALNYALEITEISPVSLMDVGSGTGAAAWAVNSLVDLKSITCFEQEDAMIEIGKSFMKGASLPLSGAEWIKHDVVNESIPKKADLVIASYVLNEMKEEERMKVIEKLWNAANMMLLIVEPGTSISFLNMIKTRDLLLKLGANIVAPCPHESKCEISLEEWCHFSCRIVRSIMHRKLKDGDLSYEDEKFTYIAVTREKYDVTYRRILRHPYVEKGKVTLDLCTKDGIKNVVISKREGNLYKRARKAKWGDVI